MLLWKLLYLNQLIYLFTPRNNEIPLFMFNILELMMTNVVVIL